MRITIILGPFLPVPAVLGGAAEKAHLLLAGAYRSAGHDVTIVSRRYRNFPRQEVVEGIRHIRIPSFGRSSSLAANLILDLLYAFRAAVALPKADVTITNGVFLPLLIPARKAGKIYVQLGRYPKHQMFLCFRADRVQAVSRAVAEAVIRQSPWLARRIKVIGYAIPDACFRPPADPRRENTILFVGRIAREKGVELLLKAFMSLQHATPDILDGWKLRIVGPHEISQGGDGAEYLDELKALADPIGSRCEFAGPLFDQDELIREYQSASIFVYPSLAEFGEALGVAPLEAMAARCAVIVSDLSCFDDYLESGATGLKFDRRAPSPEANLAFQLRRLITDPGLLKRLAETGHRVACRFQTAEIATRMIDDFESLLVDQDARHDRKMTTRS